MADVLPEFEYMARIAEVQRLCARPDRQTEVWDWAPQLLVEELDAAAALVSVLCDEEAVIMGSVGLPPAIDDAGAIPLSHSLCKYVVYAHRPIRLTEIDKIAFLKHTKAVQEVGAVSYMGVPLVGVSSKVIGALCVVDTKHRAWPDSELDKMLNIGAIVSHQMQSIN